MTQLEIQIPTDHLPDWLNVGPGSKVAQIYRLLEAAGSRGITNVELARWGSENFCTSYMERLRDIRKARSGSIMKTPGATRGTWIYTLTEYA